MRKMLIISLCLFLSGCSSDVLVPENEVDMLNSKNTPTTKSVEKVQEVESPATGTNFTRGNEYIDRSLNQVDDYANQLNQQINLLDELNK